ncbi:MAG TPA: c-type cytochrome [Balneolales bacterium]|nr:c-type cytochrome [Balneolales bacterium]
MKIIVMKYGFSLKNIWILPLLLAAGYVTSALPNKTVSHQSVPGNHPPVVKIITPENGSNVKWDTPIRYKIRVSDEEDGDSRFGEITPSEVFLEVRYEPDPSKISRDTIRAAQPDPQGLAAIRTSNCVTCHAFDATRIGPSFAAISRKYPATKPDIERLSKHIIDGSTGIWGNASMPSHPDLTTQQAKGIVRWIMQNGSNPDLNYYTGLKGVIRLKRPENYKPDGVFILTASYTDHGTKDNQERRLRGDDILIIHVI